MSVTGRPPDFTTHFAAARLVFLVTGLCFLRRPTEMILLEPNPFFHPVVRRPVVHDSDDLPPTLNRSAFVAVILW